MFTTTRLKTIIGRMTTITGIDNTSAVISRRVIRTIMKSQLQNVNDEIIVGTDYSKNWNITSRVNKS